MSNFKLRILGCGSALPTKLSFQTSQILETHSKLFMIDCGEGTQIRLRTQNIKISRLNHLFLSHLHGDHCFGVIGLLSSLDLLGRTSTFFIHCPAEFERLVRPQIDFFCKDMAYKVEFAPYSSGVVSCIYEDNALTVETIPLKHRMPCCGFLFKEKAKPRHINRRMVDFYHVPVRMMNRIKNGEDFILDSGEVVPNERLTLPSDASVSYAYCSDTAYNEKIVEQIYGVDCLFHEATFLDAQKARAKETMHSTSVDAAKIASLANAKQLIIGHFSARYEDREPFLAEARTIFSNTFLAEDCKVFDF